MDRPVLKPAAAPPYVSFADAPARGPAKHASASPKSKRRIRPGWKATIVRSDSFARLRVTQESTTDPVTDLTYLADACLQKGVLIGSKANAGKFADHQNLLGELMAKGATILICPMCMKHYGVEGGQPDSRAEDRQPGIDGRCCLQGLHEVADLVRRA